MQNLEAIRLEDKFLRVYYNLAEHTSFDRRVHDLADLEILRDLYNFKSIHVFDATHKQLYSTDEQLYPGGLLQKIDSLVRTTPERMRIIDASNYNKGGEVLLFYYIPITDVTGIKGSVLVQENLTKLWQILLETTGMGLSGESYIVGKDSTMRSPSRFLVDVPPGEIVVDTDATRRAFSREEGQGIIDDYRQIPVLSVYRKIDNADITWAIMTEMDEKEAMQPILVLRNYFVITAMASIVLTVLITYVISNRIVKPILHLKEVIITLSKGIVSTDIRPLPQTDEIGEISQAVATLAIGMERTTVFAERIGAGDLEASFDKLSNDDQLGQALLQMRDELRRFQDQILRAARARAAALLEGQENERRRIIKELHDGVGQMLTAIRMQVDAAEGLSDSKTHIKEMINDTINEVKRISYNVMPQSIVDFGLEAALRGICNTIGRLWQGTIDYKYIAEANHKLNFEVSIAAFRIAQEGLNNVVRHADAGVVRLYVVDKEDELYMLLEDDGVGFVMDEGVSGSGLRNIRERADLLNGEVSIETTPGKGTSIEVHIPLKS
jgi:signal transduction histidine kinase